MSIKGASKELFVGKKESNIISLLGNKKRISYDDLKLIEYSYAEFGEIGYIKFINNENKTTRFEFTRKVNEKIEKTVELIHENNPDLRITERRVEDLKFYQKWWFSIILMVCCLPPIGLLLMWYNKKFTHRGRIIITLIMFVLWSTEIYRYANAVDNLTDVYIQANEAYVPSTNDKINNTSDAIQETDAFATTLTTGHYVVGTDIPVGTYNFYSKKGSGNLISSDGTVNAIFDHNKESGKNIGLDNFGTEELNNVYLANKVILTITGSQEISAGCDDGLVESMQERNQGELKELEVGYGNYGASDNIPAGTYDVEWIEGRGNIICSSSIDSGINEIMGEFTDKEFDKTLITTFRNLILNDGDILEIDDIKVKLVPSK